MLQDAHIHLQDVPEGERSIILGGTTRDTVGRFFCNAGTPDDWADIAILVQGDDRVIPFYGIHPWYVDDVEESALKKLESRAEGEYCGIGEIGLDGNKSSFARQEEFFARQVELAIRLDRPFAVHCVDAWGPLLEALRGRDLAGRRFMLHAFNGSADVLAELVEMGAYISYSVRGLESRTEKMLSAVRATPRDRLLLETDFPYLMAKDEQRTAACYRSRIARAYAAAAELAGVEPSALERIVWDNGTVFTD